METEEKLLDFIIGKENSPIIKVIGVGGGGCNAVKHMFEEGIHDVGFVVCNTDYQALEDSPVKNTLLLGEGLGAGGVVSVARNAALESLPKIERALEDNTKMVFITTGMGGGTGTGASPIIAKAAKDKGVLTVAIATIPFKFEGTPKREKALNGIAELEPHVDALLVIDNEKLKENNQKLGIKDCFKKADEVLANAAKGISEIITVTGHINRDFSDVKYVLQDSGIAIMNSGIGIGEQRIKDAIDNALSSNLLSNNNYRTSKKILMVFYCSRDNEITMEECGAIDDFIMKEMNHKEIEVIWGIYFDDALGDDVKATIIATGFEGGNMTESNNVKKPGAKRYRLDGTEIIDDAETSQASAGNTFQPAPQLQPETFAAGRVTMSDINEDEDYYARMFEGASAFKRRQTGGSTAQMTAPSLSGYTVGKEFKMRDTNNYTDPKVD